MSEHGVGCAVMVDLRGAQVGRGEAIELRAGISPARDQSVLRLGRVSILLRSGGRIANSLEREFSPANNCKLRQPGAAMTRPLFNVAWAASQQVYDHEAVTDSAVAARVARVIGGMVARNIDSGEWKNTCAVRMSYILGQSNVQIPYVAGKTVSGADKRWYFFRVKDLIEYLTRQWGKPDLAAPYPPAGGGALAGKQGIVLFEVSGWRDAAGHATLWNGRLCYDHCYFNEQGATYRTERANFWSLQ